MIEAFLKGARPAHQQNSGVSGGSGADFRDHTGFLLGNLGSVVAIVGV